MGGNAREIQGGFRIGADTCMIFFSCGESVQYILMYKLMLSIGSKDIEPHCTYMMILYSLSLSLLSIYDSLYVSYED